MTSRKQRVDLDSPWKEIIEHYFPEFMAFFFPQIHADIDWTRGYEFLDKELQRVVRDAQLGRRFADKLIKVWRKSGEEQWVLIHIEVQNQPETEFGKRMYTYNHRLFDKYSRPIVSLAVLSDERRRWRPKKYNYQLWGCKINFEFPIVKLLDYEHHWDVLEASSNPFAVVVMAHLKAQATQRKPEERELWKLILTRRLYEKGYERQDIINLFHFIDWIMTLSPDLDREFWQQMSEFEEEKKMPYISSIERIATEEGFKKGRQVGVAQGVQEGLQQGLQQGAYRQLLRLLRHRFTKVSEKVQERLQKLPTEQLEKLVDIALEATTLDEFVKALPPQPTSDQRHESA